MSGRDERFEESLEELETGPDGGDAEPGSKEAAEADAASHPSIGPLRERFGDAVLRHEVVAGDEHVVFIRPERAIEVLGWLKEDASQRYDFLADVTAVDYGGGRPIQVVYQLWSMEYKRQLRVKAELPLDALEIDSAVALWHTANWLEREVYDLFGVEFRGHPDLRRILMPDNYAEGHPLRKDFPLRGRFSRAEQTRRALATKVEDDYIPSELEVVGGAERGRAAASPVAPLAHRVEGDEAEAPAGGEDEG